MTVLDHQDRWPKATPEETLALQELSSALQTVNRLLRRCAELNLRIELSEIDVRTVGDPPDLKYYKATVEAVRFTVVI